MSYWAVFGSTGASTVLVTKLYLPHFQWGSSGLAALTAFAISLALKIVQRQLRYSND